MAFQGVQVVSAPGVATGKKGREGGGKEGQMLGAAVGGIVGGMASGGSGAMTGASAGAGLGAMAGQAVDPGQANTQAMQRRVDSAGPQIVHSEQSEKLKQSLMALQSQPPEIQQQYQAPLVHAYIKSIAMDNPAEATA